MYQDLESNVCNSFQGRMSVAFFYGCPIIKLHTLFQCNDFSDSKVHGANMGPTWVLSAPDGPHVGPMSLAIRVDLRWAVGSVMDHALLLLSKIILFFISLCMSQLIGRLINTDVHTSVTVA